MTYRISLENAKLTETTFVTDSKFGKVKAQKATNPLKKSKGQVGWILRSGSDREVRLIGQDKSGEAKR
jgi:hypothetical protein